MSAKRTVITVPSNRSPRTQWTRPRSTSDVIDVLERNAFESSSVDAGIALVRVAGIFAVRVSIVRGHATLETGQRIDGQLVKWKRWPGIGSAPWQVAAEALEYLAVISVDTPIQWG